MAMTVAPRVLCEKQFPTWETLLSSAASEAGTCSKQCAEVSLSRTPFQRCSPKRLHGRRCRHRMQHDDSGGRV
jgi:hypothetical protein